MNGPGRMHEGSVNVDYRNAEIGYQGLFISGEMQHLLERVILIGLFETDQLNH